MALWLHALPTAQKAMSALQHAALSHSKLVLGHDIHICWKWYLIMLTEWCCAFCMQLPIARVRFVAVSATIPNIQVSSTAGINIVATKGTSLQ